MSKNNKRIVYNILEYNPLLDSSNMTTDDWGRIGKDIEVFCCSVINSSNLYIQKLDIYSKMTM